MRMRERERERGREGGRGERDMREKDNSVVEAAGRALSYSTSLVVT